MPILDPIHVIALHVYYISKFMLGLSDLHSVTPESLTCMFYHPMCQVNDPTDLRWDLNTCTPLQMLVTPSQTLQKPYMKCTSDFQNLQTDKICQNKIHYYSLI